MKLVKGQGSPGRDGSPDAEIARANMIADWAVERYALPNSITRAWAQRWLSGEDRSASGASGAARAAAEVAEAAAGAAWTAASAEWAEWAEAASASACAAEYRTQRDDLLELLRAAGMNRRPIR